MGLKIDLYKNKQSLLLDNEIWYNVIGWSSNIDQKYSYSNFGRIKSNNRKVKAGCGTRIVCEKIIPQHENWRGKGYLYVYLSNGKKSQIVYVHKLIAKCHFDNNKNLKSVNHKDLNPRNNNINNLEWCSLEDNIKHYQLHLNNRIINGERVSNYRFTKDEIIDIYNSNLKMREISNKYNVNWKTIKDIKLKYTFRGITQHLPDNKPRRYKLKKEIILDIYSNRHLPVKIMINKHGLSEGAIIAVRTGRRHSKITGHKIINKWT